jgi:hypothetical protein
MRQHDYFYHFKQSVDKQGVPNTREEFQRFCLERHKSWDAAFGKKTYFAAVAQHLLGKDDGLIKADRAAAKGFLNDCGFCVIEQVFSPRFEGADTLGRLAIRVETLANADLVYFLDGFDASMDCFIELSICVHYGIPFYYADRHSEKSNDIRQMFTIRDSNNTYHTLYVEN